MEFELEFKRGRGPDAFQKALNEFADTLENELLDEWETMMKTLRERVQDLAPVDTGKLRDSYEDMARKISDGLRGKVKTNVPYAPFQEFLEYGKSHLGPAFEEAKPLFEQHVETAWNRAVQKVS